MTSFNWYDDIEISYNSKKYGANFITMKSEFENMWNSEFGQISTAQHTFDLSVAYLWSIYFMPYRVGPKFAKVRKIELTKT